MSSVLVDQDRVESTRRALAAYAVPGRHAVLAPADATDFVHMFLAAERLGVPLVLGGPEQQRVAFGAPRSGPTGPLVDFAVDDSPVALASTSGTSGVARYCLWDRAMLDYQLGATQDRLGTGSSTRFGLALGPGSSYGFSVVNLALRTGRSLAVFDPTAYERIISALTSGAMDTLDTIPGVWRYLASAMKSSPQLMRAVRDLDVRGVGGEVVSHALLDWFADVEAPLHNGYGLTEAGPNVAISFGDDYRARTVGTPLSGTDVRVDPDGGLCIRSPGVATRVWDTAAGAAVANVEVGVDGWLRTRDIGSMDDDGFVTVLGRSDGLLVGHGAKMHSSVLEERLRGVCDDIVEVSALQVDPRSHGTPRVVVALVSDGPVAHAAEYIARVRRFPPEFRVRDIVSIARADVPTTVTGKLDRRGLTRIVSDHLNGDVSAPCMRVF